jgi:pimeloyl-ACP methyl ester carboxylesterase
MMPGHSETIERGYVETGGLLVHYRVCGSGPAVVLLHDSPRSSRLHIPLMKMLASRFRVFALDTPGYGNSDPLDLPNPTIPDFACALNDTLAALNLTQAPVYATHTSAKIALALAARGGQMPLLVLDGLSIPDALASDTFIESYMRPFAPEPTGAWLGAEWSRTRDMLRWFPWFATGPQNRIAMEPPSPEWMESYGIDLFSAGRNYAGAYTAAMRWSPLDDLLTVKVPTIVGARTDDVLYPHLDKVPCAANPALSIQRLGADRDVWAEWIATALDSKASAPEPMTTTTARRGYVALDHGQLHWERYPARNGGEARPLLVLSAPATLEAHRWAQALAEYRKVIVPDLPGFGDSDPLPQASADGIADALAALISDPVDVLAIGLAAPLGATLAARHADHVAALAVWGAPSFDPPALDALCPDIAFDALAGSHLHQFWHMLRDGDVQWPWFDASPPAARAAPALPHADALHRALTGMLKQRTNYSQPVAAALAAHDAAVWQAVNVPVLVAVGNDPAMAGAAALIDLLPRGAAFIAPADADQAAATLASALGKASREIMPS